MDFKIIFALSVVVIAIGSCSLANADATGAGGAEIKVIEQTNLLTGVYYRITLPHHLFAYLTWANRMVNGLNDAFFLQMDDHEYREAKYVQGGEWYQDALWYITSTDMAGFYKIHNGADKGRVIAVTTEPLTPPDQAPKDYYLTSIIDCPTNNTYWEIVPTGDLDTYELRNYGLQGLAATALRFGSFYRWIRLKQQAEDGRRVSFDETASTHFRFKAVAVSLGDQQQD